MTLIDRWLASPEYSAAHADFNAAVAFNVAANYAYLAIRIAWMAEHQGEETSTRCKRWLMSHESRAAVTAYDAANAPYAAAANAVAAARDAWMAEHKGDEE